MKTFCHNIQAHGNEVSPTEWLSQNAKFLLQLLLLLMFSAVTQAQTTTGTTADGLIWSATNSQASITGYSGMGGAVNIPGTINGLPVTSIGDHAFNCSPLTYVSIPNTVISIGVGAFSATNLATVTIPSSVTSIGSDAFRFCVSLTSIMVNAPNSAYSSVDGVLLNTQQTSIIKCPEGRAGSYTIPVSVTSIESTAFYYCNKLATIAIPNSVITIGDNAFSYCSSLTSITIPNSVTSIGNNAFSYCGSLTGITIPNSVTSIGSYAFNRTSLTSITIPNSVTTIGNNAFSYCSNLTSIAIPNSVTSIERETFYGCSSLSNTTIPNSVTNIADLAFYGCTSLTSVTIPNRVTYMGYSAFNSCNNLKNAIFMGNAPSFYISIFGSRSSGFTVNYFDGATGFTSPTWKGYAAVNMGGFSPVKPWLLSKGLPYDTDLRSEPNGDGVPLLMAYALDLNPSRNQSGGLPRPVVTADTMSLTYYAGNADVTYTVQSSADLQTWSTVSTVSTPDANNFCTATVPSEGSRLFMRLVVSH